MKVLALFAVVAIALCAAANVSTPKPLDGHNSETVMGILKDAEKMTAYLKCVVNKGPCTPSSERLKAITINALSEECSKCDANQKALLASMSAFVAEKQPASWEEMKNLYDPKKEHRKYIDGLVAAGKAAQAAKAGTAVPAASA